MYRSSSSPLGGGEGEGDLDGRPSLNGVPSPLSPIPPAAGYGGSSGSGGLDSGSTVVFAFVQGRCEQVG